MNETGAPALEVGFVIDTGGSFSELQQLQQAMGSAEAKIVGEAKAIEAATKGMLNLGGSTAQVRTFGSAATQELESVRQSTARLEKSAEGMIRQLQRQAETYGKTTSEIRNMRAEQRAAAAEAQGMTDLAGRLRAAAAEMNRLEAASPRVGAGIGSVGATGKLATHHMTNLAYQFQDLGVQMAMAAQSSAPLKMGLMALMQQGSQISMIMSQAGIGIRGVAGAFGTMAKSALLAVATNPYLLAFGAAAGAASLAVRALNKSANEGAAGDMQAYARSLGLTTKEIRNLDNVTVTTGDTIKAVFQVAGRAIWGAVGPAVTSVWDVMKEWVGWIGTGVKSAINFLIGGFVGGYNAITKTWSSFPAVLGNIFYSAVNASIAAINALIQRSVDGINGFIATANGVLGKFGLALPSLTAPQIAQVENVHAGAARKAAGAWKSEFKKAMGTDYVGNFADRAGASIIEQARRNARDRLRDQAESKGYLDPEKGKTSKPKNDRHAEQLARENEAIEAQIKNLYALADAYNVSGAAALIAEARVKAESDAIKKRGDIEVFVNRQIRLSIAQRVSDAAKASATMREQTAAQRQVNDMVAAGIVPAERAADLVKEQIADLPLLAAIEAAQQRGLATDAARATAELDRQRAARAAANAEAARAKVLADTTSTNDQLDRLRLEASLINATNRERAVAIAQLEVEQYLRANPGISSDDAERYRAARVSAAETQVAVAAIRSDVDLLIERLQAMADQTSVSATLMSEAFGNVGNVIGTAMENFAAYQVQRVQFDKAVAAGTMSETAREKALAALRVKGTAAAISGLKGMFAEHSKGYKVMATIEKAYAAFQAVQTALSIAQDIAKTATHVANSGVRTAANTAEGGSKIFAELGPWAFPVVAAMVAVLAALGAKGGGGAGSGPSIPTADDLQAGAGTGTVLGDTKAKSESITRSLELVAANTNKDLEYSNEMLKALRSIDTSIAKMAGTVARQIQVSGSMFDTTKLGLGETSKSGFLGLFGGSSTSKTLFDLGMTLNSGSVADIIANGIAGTTYQVVQKIKTKKGFLGIGGGTKTSYITTTGEIDPEITAAVQDVIRSLRDGLVAGADIIGLPGAQAILDAFQVNIGKISFKDMTGSEIEEQLNAIFSSIGDQMAGTLLPSLASMQLVGEGLFETFMRVAKEYQAVDVAMASIGRTFGQVGLESVAARDALVQLFGGLEDFISATDFFRDNFLTEAQRIAPVLNAVATELVRLGQPGLTTRDQFRDAVLALDLTTESGREMYASLMALAPAFDKVLAYNEQARKEAASTLESTLDTFQKLTEGLKKYRDTLFATDMTQPNAYGLLRDRFLSTATLAANGDQAALNGLESAGRSFLEAARNNASTREEYLRDVAIVARSVDAGIFAADAQADYAQLQLDALNHANELLAAIAAATAAAAAAVGGTVPTVPPVTPEPPPVVDVGTVVPPPPAPDPVVVDLRAGIFKLHDTVERMRLENNAGLSATAGNTNRMANKLDDVTSASGGDAISMAAVA